MFKIIVPTTLALALATGVALADGGGVAAPDRVPGAKAQPVSALNLSSEQVQQLANEAGVTTDAAMTMTLSDLVRMKEKHDS